MDRDQLAQTMNSRSRWASPVGPFPGMLAQPNIDLEHRPVVRMPDGSIATVRSVSNEMDGAEVVMPTVSPEGKLLSNPEAMQLFRRTGQHLGKFAGVPEAEMYARALHEAQARFYGGR